MHTYIAYIYISIAMISSLSCSYYNYAGNLKGVITCAVIQVHCAGKLIGITIVLHTPFEET